MAVIKHIIGSFGDIGAEIVKEAAKVPGDVAGKALESLGGQSGKSQKQQNFPKKGTSGEKTLDQGTDTISEQEKRARARQTLIEYIGYGKSNKEPTTWEKKQMEDKQRERVMGEEKKQKEKLSLPKLSYKRKPGNLYGIPEKSSSERSKNVRAE